MIVTQHTHRQTRGQIMLIIAVALVGLLAFTGLAIDLGRYFVVMGRLRQAADAGVLAAASQFRENSTLTDMTHAARSVIQANGFTPTTLQVDTCATDPGDPYLCNPPRRKKVRVIVTADMPTTFMRIVGIDTIHMEAEAVGEAAAMDVVLVLDTSDSMTYDAAEGDPMRDPSQCNPVHGCRPFESVRSAALSFARRILNLPAADEQDRVAVVTFSAGHAGTGPVYAPGATDAWTYDYATAATIINSMQVYDPGWTCTEDDIKGKTNPPAVGPCRRYNLEDGHYEALDCPLLRNKNYKDPSTCTTTNIGGGLSYAAQLFGGSGREDALWVVVLLTDGAANATGPAPDDVLTSEDTLRATLPFGYCPPSTFGGPFCRDIDPDTRHPATHPYYDADDYARDMADYVACSAVNPAAGCATAGQNAIIFSIGLGNQVLTSYGSNPKPHGGALLRYIAAVGDDGDPSTDPCQGITDYTTWCGNYYFAPTGSQLDQVFEDIASRLFTRLAH